MAGVPQGSDADPAVRSDGQPGQAGVLQRDPQPRLGWELEGAADEVTDDVCVTHHDLVTVLPLLRLRPVKVFPERSFDPRPVSEVIMIRPPGANTRLGPDWGSLPENALSGQHLDLGEMLGNQVRRLDGPGHVRSDDVGVGEPQSRQSRPSTRGLALAQVSEEPLGVSLTLQVVLAVPDQDEVSTRLGFAPLVVVLVCLPELGGVPPVPVVVPLGPGPLITAITVTLGITIV